MKSPFESKKLQDIFVLIAGLMGIKTGLDISKNVINSIMALLMMGSVIIFIFLVLIVGKIFF